MEMPKITPEGDRKSSSGHFLTDAHLLLQFCCCIILSEVSCLSQHLRELFSFRAQDLIMISHLTISCHSYYRVSCQIHFMCLNKLENISNLQLLLKEVMQVFFGFFFGCQLLISCTVPYPNHSRLYTSDMQIVLTITVKYGLQKHSPNLRLYIHISYSLQHIVS